MVNFNFNLNFFIDSSAFEVPISVDKSCNADTTDDRYVICNFKEKYAATNKKEEYTKDYQKRILAKKFNDDYLSEKVSKAPKSSELVHHLNKDKLINHVTSKTTDYLFQKPLNAIEKGAKSSFHFP